MQTAAPGDYDFDVIIAGAGPAGLLIASILPPRFRLLVIDRGLIGMTRKFWLTSVARLKKHDLDSCILHRTDRGSIGSFLGGLALATGDFAVVDEHCLLNRLVERCAEKGAAFVANADLRGVHWLGRRIVVSTNQGQWRTRLMIDATGGSSPIAATFRLHRLDGFFSIYGGHIEKIRLHTQDIIGAHVLRLGYPTPIFEVFPTSSSSAFVVVFLATRRLARLDSMRACFDDHVRANPFFDCTSDTKEIEGKMGGIPIGRLRRKSLPGIFPFGEARLIQSPLIGGAFNETLEEAQHACQEIERALDRGDGLADVRFPVTNRKRFNDVLQRPLVRNLFKGTLEEYHRIVRLLEELGPHASYRLFCSALTPPDLPRVTLAFARSRLWTLKATASGS